MRRHAFSRFFISSIIMIAVLLIFSCARTKCKDGFPYLKLDGFSRAEMQLMEIKEYEPGTGWNQLKRTFYLGDSIRSKSTDSIPGREFGMDINSFYKITILKTNNTYIVHHIQQKQSYHKQWVMGEADQCVNGYSYSVNSSSYTTEYRVEHTYMNAYGIAITISKRD